MIRAENVSMRFGGLYALNKVSFEVREGELFSIIGPNGSGKSTMFNVITGVYTPTEGRIFLGDREITGQPIYKINHSGIARTFQNPRLFSELTAFENVMIPLFTRSSVPIAAEIFSARRQKDIMNQIKPAAMNALEVTGLSDKAEIVAENLSYGDQKRLEIARCYAVSPSVILLDEPVAGLNTDEREEMKALANSLNKSGMTIVLIEHDMKMVMGISDRIMVLNHGSTIAFGSPKEISNNKDVIEAYLGTEDGYAENA